MKKAFLLTIKDPIAGQTILSYNSEKKFEKAMKVIETYNTKVKDGFMYTIVYTDGSDELLGYRDGLIRTLEDKGLLGNQVVKMSTCGIV